MPSFPFQKGCIDFFDKHTTLVGPAQKVYFINHLDEFVIAKALWLSWLKRLSSKQEITGSNPVSAYFFLFFFFFQRQNAYHTDNYWNYGRATFLIDVCTCSEMTLNLNSIHTIPSCTP